MSDVFLDFIRFRYLVYFLGVIVFLLVVDLIWIARRKDLDADSRSIVGHSSFAMVLMIVAIVISSAYSQKQIRGLERQFQKEIAKEKHIKLRSMIDESSSNIEVLENLRRTYEEGNPSEPFLYSFTVTSYESYLANPLVAGDSVNRKVHHVYKMLSKMNDVIEYTRMRDLPPNTIRQNNRILARNVDQKIRNIRHLEDVLGKHLRQIEERYDFHTTF